MFTGNINWFKFAAPQRFYPMAGKLVPFFTAAGLALADRFWTPAPPLMRLSREGFSDSTRGLAPAPLLPLRPRFPAPPPRNCCASASFFFFSRFCFTKLSKEILGVAIIAMGQYWGVLKGSARCCRQA